ncbi:unnamed protein product [Mesocestoides corti]|uniref:Ubiquitin carboxyl-terminal hydrolase n=1 Tax=Mesocestoides corti TaxID=53468 RepID=A0A0R3UEZ7_MESCO|nr:unnamed protein product [Mesocestoides corti]
MSDSGDWCLIESDPGVFNELMKGFGVEGLETIEIYDLSDISSFDDALGFIFLFKWEGTIEQSGQPVEGDALKSIFFAEQIIRNACATQAIINIILNLPTTRFKLGDTLSGFKSFVSEFDSKMKGTALANCDKLRTTHNSFSNPQVFEIDNKGATGGEDAYHFVGYVPINGAVYELDGLKPSPILHGSVPEGSSWIDVIKPVISKRMNSCIDGKFNLMAIVPDRLQLYQTQLAEILSAPSPDAEMVKQLQRNIEIEKLKFASQRTENIRRRHNYLPLLMEVFKVLAENGRLSEVVRKAKDKSKDLRDRNLIKT